MARAELIHQKEFMEGFFVFNWNNLLFLSSQNVKKHISAFRQIFDYTENKNECKASLVYIAQVKTVEKHGFLLSTTFCDFRTIKMEQRGTSQWPVWEFHSKHQNATQNCKLHRLPGMVANFIPKPINQQRSLPSTHCY